MIVTAAEFGAAVPPKLSVTLTRMGSEPGVPSVSVRVASAAFTWTSVPDSVRSVDDPPTGRAIGIANGEHAGRIRQSHVERVSVPVDPLSETLMPEIVASLFSPITVAVPGTVITGVVPAVTPIVF